MEKPLIGLYLRLSEEDGREVSDESNSITSQREILKTYVRQHQELADCPTIEAIVFRKDLLKSESFISYE